MVRQKKKVKELLKKSKDSAILAVDLYNKPATTFKSYGYIILMIIAWTSLLHAIFERDGVKYYFRDQQHPRRYVYLDGDKKAWDLATCIHTYFPDKNAPVVKNLYFFIPMRNRIEHRFLPALDMVLQGECQALLLNYESLLTKEFGDKESLNACISIPLQVISNTPGWRREVLNKLQAREYSSIINFIQYYRSKLPDDTWNSSEYCFRAFLIPKTGNNPRTADITIEFVQNSPDLDKQIVLVKEKQVQVPVSNQGWMKAKEVAMRVSTALGIRFSWSNHHSTCWKYYQIRPPRGDPDPSRTKTEYCRYDPAFKEYVYSEKWVELLISELSSEETLAKIFGERKIGKIVVEGVETPYPIIEDEGVVV